MSQLHKLTVKTIKAAVSKAKHEGRMVRLADGGWLTLLVKSTGACYWQQRYRYGGKARTISFGAFPEVNLAEARKRSREAREQLRSELDPMGQRRVHKAVQRDSEHNTFAAAAEAWFDYNLPRWKKATAAKARQYLDKDILPAIGNRPLIRITPPEMGEVIAKIEARGALNVAAKARQWCNAIFKYSIARGWTTSNPAEHLREVKAHTPKGSRYPHLPPDELPELLHALDEWEGSPLTAGAIWLSLWTANRPGVIRTLRWDELDLDAALWTIEKDREFMKLGYRHLTPLPRQAVAMLRDLHRLTSTFKYVFPGRDSPRKPMSDAAVNKALKIMLGDGRQTAHGFRHLVSTALNDRGHNPDHVERQLAHGDPDKIRGTYNEAEYLDQRRDMMQAWADELDVMRRQAVPLLKTA